MAMDCRRFVVNGRVQGVWFRDSTRREALALGLVGYAVNLPDGRVEVLACGDVAKLDRLQTWLAHGPPMAKVEHLDVHEFAGAIPAGFLIGNAGAPRA